MESKPFRLIIVAAIVLSVGSGYVATNFYLFVIDAPTVRETLLVKRMSGDNPRFIQSEKLLCQDLDSVLGDFVRMHLIATIGKVDSVSCENAVVRRLQGRRHVMAHLPYSEALHNMSFQ